ncbi:hypothetical protein C492_07115 [Natronococcus jeotgali DSM 18795]|uniref:Uncharacterized protein n=1 Tax=Natronococcus jeotgali DSM 18795 TaxID=1227498 RepID=L9XPN2_9EURY|nr:hypothetical protein C492_07115 [Natronococcus jeotgali DSM 18795]
MSFRELLGPDSLDQIVYVILFWSLILFGSAYILDEQIIRLESIVGTGILLAWVIWAINYRLQQVQQERYEKRRR